MSKIIHNKVAVRVNNTTESHYLIKTSTQTATFSVVTSEQSNFIKPVDTEPPKLCVPELTTYLNELHRVNKSEQQNNTSFPTLKNPGKTEDHTPIQTQMLRKLLEMKEEEKINPKDDTHS